MFWLKNKILLNLIILSLIYLTNASSSHKIIVKRHLKSLGYLPNDLKITHKQLQQAIATFQQNHGLNVTGKINNDILKLITQPRCGVPDIVDKKQTRNKRFAVYNVKWDSTQVTWSYLEDRDKFDHDSSLIISQIIKVFNEWSRHSRLTFTRVNSLDANIVISFQKPNHPEVDSYPMEGTTLAHAFFPRKGDVHLRNDLVWNFGDKPLESHEHSFFRVLLHEVGHSLGLQHSQDANSIMFGYYSSHRMNLHYDDINGIQHIYGTPLHLKATTQSVDSIDSDVEIDKCDFNSIDAIVNIRGELMLFKDRYMWRLAYGHDKLEIRRLWNGLPEDFIKIDAIHETENNEIWIFIGNEIYIFNGTEFSRIISLSHLGISQNVEKIDAIFKWHRNHVTYILSGENYWRLDENLKTLENYPKHITKAWHEVRDVDSIYDDGEKLFVFKGKYYYEFNDQKMRLNWTQPHSIAREFMNCTIVTNRFNLHDEEEVKDYIVYGDGEIPEYPDDDENIEKMNDSGDELIANIRLPILIFSAIWILVY